RPVWRRLWNGPPPTAPTAEKPAETGTGWESQGTGLSTKLRRLRAAGKLELYFIFGTSRGAAAGEPEKVVVDAACAWMPCQGSLGKSP
ncbi:hypothetical protein JMJ77_0002532, partial [Colletotrichum scovillei]